MKTKGSLLTPSPPPPFPSSSSPPAVMQHSPTYTLLVRYLQTWTDKICACFAGILYTITIQCVNDLRVLFRRPCTQLSIEDGRLNNSFFSSHYCVIFPAYGKLFTHPLSPPNIGPSKSCKYFFKHLYSLPVPTQFRTSQILWVFFQISLPTPQLQKNKSPLVPYTVVQIELPFVMFCSSIPQF